MGRAVAVRADYTADEVRRLAKQAKDGAQARRLPRHDSTGGKQKLGPISKQGDRYLRRILIVGAHAVLRRAKFKAFTSRAAFASSGHGVGQALYRRREHPPFAPPFRGCGNLM
jgi:transposase